MKLAVFGASGGIGQRVVEQALAAHHAVTAIVRTIPSTTADTAKIKLPTFVQGDVVQGFDSAILADHDAVVFTVGVGGNKSEPTTLYSVGVQNVLQAMQEQKVRRFIGISASGFVNDPNDNFLVQYAFKPMLQYILRHPYEDLQRMEAIVQSTKEEDFDWTLIRPARLVDGVRTGVYRTEIDALVPDGSSIARADIADWIVQHGLQENARDDCYHRIVGIAY